ncbi:MAG: V-type ATP synthase subunit D [Clostridia bacterium]|nr:V-type ATP synthase subunit D [Clostridia bacterium]
MAVMRVNPTRMELKRLKARLKTASRGHKLLKDKSDEMIRRFTDLIRENKRLREEVEAELSSALKAFLFAGSLTSPEALGEAIMMPSASVTLNCSTKNIMSVEVPSISVVKEEAAESFPYSFATVTAEADEAIVRLNMLLVQLVRLAEVEKACNMLAIEIEKNKRRVNALEYVMIPQMEETIHDITMKLDENERGNLIRLMKVKSMLAARDE